MQAILYLIALAFEIVVGRRLLDRLHPNSDIAHVFEVLWGVALATTLMGAIIHLFK